MIRLRFSYFYAHERRQESSPASPQLTNTFLVIAHTECPKIYRKSVLHLLKYTTNLVDESGIGRDFSLRSYAGKHKKYRPSE